MLDQSIRTAILALHEQQHGVRTIARMLDVSRGAVRSVLRAQSAEVPRLTREELAGEYEAAIRELYLSSKGNLVRVHEQLLERGAALSYQALTAFCRRRQIGAEPPRPSGRYHFAPGEEMQHDTSPHRVEIGGAERLVQTASLVLCYSRRIYIQAYPSFTRFACKVFLTDALRYFGGAARRCMIDNTHVVVLRGTGKSMVPVPEMAAFGERFSFAFEAHEKGDANRSARVERPFDFIENNFFAGRTFDDFDHLNGEAVIWCDKVNAAYMKHLRTTRRELFVIEAPTLQPLPAYVPPVYLLHQRIVDLEGYVHVDGHVYSVPYQLIGRRVEVREEKDQVLVFEGPRQVAVHRRHWGPGKQRITEPAHRPPRGSGGFVALTPPPDERDLQAAEPLVAAYASTLKTRSTTRWPVALRRLAQMRRDYPRKPFLAAVAEAAHYGLYDLERLDRMVLRHIAHDYFVVPDTRRHEDEG
jgi:HPt (histidine-containing phosphotransfer) domain-containing protein